ncbi:MAG: 5-(carboxyamino)imidazole ribonucleotide synthase [Ilumatobacteraceae bacterium]|nr:5-(carboxyamino)imidazole ribonucleotide synthase [Ilumatobacteraceae bacterium]
MTHLPGPVLPPSTIGVLGGGQLGRYAVWAARSMGYRTVVLDPDPSAPAGRIADDHLVAPYDDEPALDRLAVLVDIVTTEFENPPASAVERLARAVPVRPGPSVLAVAQDRIAEKAFLAERGLPIGPFSPLLDASHVPDVTTTSIVKTARLGYDGKGQRAVTSQADVLAAWADLGGVPCVVEQRLDLEAELSVIVARGVDGSSVTYEVAENVHVDGILDLTVLPARVPPAIADRATGVALAVADALDVVGVLAVELFVVGGEVLVNEIAPRPHNSGHWTLDASRTSQFAQQIRMVCGLAPGGVERTAPAVAMVNLLGDRWAGGEPDWAVVLGDPRAALHLYGKATPRPGRKMGHVTVVGTNANEAVAHALDLRDRLSRG